MKKSRLFALLAAVLALSTLLTACSLGADPAKKLPENIIQKADPAQDDTLNILLLGNSYCYYYSHELYGMLEAAGIKANVCVAYYPNSWLLQHWTWWKAGEDSQNYMYYQTNGDGRARLPGKDELVSLQWCLQQQNWDVISMQEFARKYAWESGGAEVHLEKTKEVRADLIGYLQEQFPLSRHVWHDSWIPQVGYEEKNIGYKIESFEQQEAARQEVKIFSLATCKEFDLERVPTGEAWQIVRREHGYDKLCDRIGYIGEDYLHDGDIGGGQYLNACVWFEAATGQSCVGNTYRPSYKLENEETFTFTEEQIEMFQQAAHKAVEQVKAEQA